MKQTVRSTLKEKREVFTSDKIKKLALIRARIRYFEKSEVQRLLRPCTQEIWEELRNPKTGVYSLNSLKV